MKKLVWIDGELVEVVKKVLYSVSCSSSLGKLIFLRTGNDNHGRVVKLHWIHCRDIFVETSNVDRNTATFPSSRLIHMCTESSKEKEVWWTSSNLIHI